MKSGFVLLARGTQKEVEKVPILKKNSKTEPDDATNPLPALHQCPEKLTAKSLYDCSVPVAGGRSWRSISVNRCVFIANQDLQAHFKIFQSPSDIAKW